MYNYSGGTSLAPTHIYQAADSPAGGAMISVTPANQNKQVRESYSILTN